MLYSRVCVGTPSPNLPGIRPGLTRSGSRVLALTSGVYLSIGVLFLAIKFIFSDDPFFHTRLILRIPALTFFGLSGLISLGLGFGGFLMGFLRGDYGELGVASAHISETPDLTPSMEQIEQLIKRRIADRVADREHSPQIDNPSSPEIPPSQPENAIAATFIYTRGRLREEIQNLSRRSSVNLVIGVMVTMAATAILVYLVSREHAEFSSVKSLLSFYIPRITTVILIETFAYFFLKLYRQNLEEIKYYQNELTTLAAQEIAWQASIVANMPEATSAVIQQLAKSDRNGRSLPDAQSRPNSDLGGLLEILQTVSKLIASSAKAKE